jgi:acyl dehydratase
MWWPSGFYLREPGAVGHFALFHQLYPHLVGRPFLHAKSTGRFFAPFRLGAPIRSDLTVAEKYRKRGRDFIVMRAAFHDADNCPLATYHHTCAIRSDSVQRARDTAAPRPETPSAPLPGRTLIPRTIELSLEKSRLFSLPAENYHTHDKHAQAMGLRVAVPAAMMSFAYLSRFAQDHFGDAWISCGKLDVVFTRMMQRDDILTVLGSIDRERGGDTGTVLGLRIDNAQRELVAVATATMLKLES